ncbi:MAG: cytochrome c3 family protein [Candidatus Kapabacteria bacterium]|jgi:hypothetical protein|nr:cytochrome c3 family protein [Candidatus Kapabacteria bacterium]
MFTKEFDTRVKTTVKIILPVAGVIAVLLILGFRNTVTDVGYRPQQPVPFSHKIHAGQLGVKCVYCHTSVETSAHSPVPSTSTCMNCHTLVKSDSPKLKLVRESYETGKPIEWKRIHKLPDYAHFNHSRHIRAQIDCSSCHGKVEEMGVVAQNKPLSMGWCIDCHRNPTEFIVPARPISGIFTGVKAGKYDPNAKATLAQVKALTEPQFGQWETEIPKNEVKGIPVPKHPGYGPENCSSCHH